MPSMELRYLTLYKKKTPPPVPVPKAPAVPAVGAITDTSVAFTFAKNGADVVTGFDAQYRKQGDSAWTAKAGVVSPASITGLVASTAYEIQVRAKNASGAGPYSATLTASTTATP